MQKRLGKQLYFEINKDERDYAKIEIAKKRWWTGN